MTFPQQKPARTGLRNTAAALSIAAAGLLATTCAFAAGKSNAELDAQYQREKAVCTSGQSNQDKATCLREAGAAYQQARQGRLNDGQQAQYSSNALERCKALPAGDQADCQRRIENPSDVEGSVPSGGILRKDVTIVPATTQ
ncbi:hypothetical protein [Herbaspirillum lusitanum]|uniref:hypothetical protein n=1 Tax=Herbaspirillum lusitanum TaxID=213312 RepID=UPI000304BEAE|nr:hypothetical protein [Herbaspirillum lusitanum]MCW5296795.1 hypothetical protein [Herbaspirillum lusitanum]